MTARFVNPVTQYLDDAGDPVVNGKVFFFLSGTNTPLDTFADINLSIENSNPVILTASGRIPNIFLKSATYKEILTDADGVQIWERDPVGAESADSAFGVWNSLTIYSKNDIVEGDDGKFYVSITEGNQGNDPTDPPPNSNWTQIRFNRVWNGAETYSINQIVQSSEGLLSVSITDNNLNNDPLFDIVNWKPAAEADVDPTISSSALIFAFNNL